MKMLSATAAFFALLWCSGAGAYEEQTHSILSQRALEKSRFGSDADVRKRLGLLLADQFPFERSAPGNKLDIVDLVKKGSEAEDASLRALNHFFEPEYETPLTFIFRWGATSPSWALEDDTTQQNQEFSFIDARKAMFEAFTKPTKADRDIEFGQVFRSLGHIVHHLQDMAQPQHVRNDPHCGIYCLWIFPSSRYERWSKDYPLTGSPVSYPDAVYPDAISGPMSARQFWKGSGKGIAEFTNKNFVSHGTNFDKQPPRFPSPTPLSEQLVPYAVACIPADICYEVDGNVLMVSTAIEDSIAPQPNINPYATSASAFDTALEAQGKPRAYALNNLSFAYAQQFLIPRAVSYSAGMLNYFFRGDIDLVFDPTEESYVIKNNSNENMSGEFRLYYDARYSDNEEDDQRIRLDQDGEWENLSIAANSNKKVKLRFPRPRPDGQPPRKTHQFILVFKGTIGDEAPVGDSEGAVTAAVVDLNPIVLYHGRWYENAGATHAGFNFLLSDSMRTRLLRQTNQLRLTVAGTDYPATGESYCNGANWCDEVVGGDINALSWRLSLYVDNVVDIFVRGATFTANERFTNLLRQWDPMTDPQRIGQVDWLCQLSVGFATSLQINSLATIPSGSTIALSQQDDFGVFRTVFKFKAHDLPSVNNIDDDVEVSEMVNSRVNSEVDERAGPPSLEPGRRITCRIREGT